MKKLAMSAVIVVQLILSLLSVLLAHNSSQHGLRRY